MSDSSQDRTRFGRGITKAVTIADVFGGVAIMGLVLALSLEVFWRWGTGNSIPGVFEAASVALPAIAFLGTAMCQEMGGHVSTSIVTERLPARIAHFLHTIGSVILTVLVAWITWAMLERALQATRTGEYELGLVSLPVWPTRWIVAMAFVLLLIVVVRQTVRAIRGEEERQLLESAL